MGVHFMNDFEYLTIKPSESLLIIKKSKFISNVFPIKNKEEAEQYLEVLRKSIGMLPIMCMHIQLEK